MTTAQPGQYRCDACGLTFDTQAELQQHNRSVHDKGQSKQPPKQQYRCEACGMSFDSEAQLREHNAKVHEKERAR